MSSSISCRSIDVDSDHDHFHGLGEHNAGLAVLRIRSDILNYPLRGNNSFEHFLGQLILSPNATWMSGAGTVAGSAAGLSGTGPSSFSSNKGIQIVDNNTLYIADTANNRVVVIRSGSTNATAIIGSLGNASSQLNAPTDVFVTSTFVYILDTLNYRVQRWSRNGSNGTTVAGITGKPGNSSSTTTFGASYGIYIDKYGYLYVSDQSNHRVLRYAPDSSSGDSSVMVAGTGTPGSAPWQLNSPSKVFVDDHRAMYIADTNNHRVNKWTYGACSGVTVAGTGTSGTTASQLNYPVAVVVDSNQYMYIVDQSNYRIQRWAPGACAGDCLVGCSGSMGSGSNLLSSPQSLAFDNQGAVYVSDGGNHRVQRFLLTSVIGT